MNEISPVRSTAEEPRLSLSVIEHMDDEMLTPLRGMTVSEKLALAGKINREVRPRVAESNRIHNQIGRTTSLTLNSPTRC